MRGRYRQIFAAFAFLSMAIAVYTLSTVQTHAGWKSSVAHSGLESVSALWSSGVILYATLETRNHDGKILAISDTGITTLVDGLQKPDGLTMWDGRLIYTQEFGIAPVFEFANDQHTPLFKAQGAEGISSTANGDVYVIEDRPEGELIKYNRKTGQSEVIVSGLTEAEGVCAHENGIIYYTEKGKGEVYRAHNGQVTTFLTDLRNPGYLKCDEASGGIWITEDRTNFGRLLFVTKDRQIQTIASRLKSPQSIAFDDAGRLLLAEQGRDRILMFERDAGKEENTWL